MPLGDESFPRAEFATSTSGMLLIRIWRYRGEQPKPRPATEADREAWPTTFHNFIESCLARRDGSNGEGLASTACGDGE